MIKNKEKVFAQCKRIQESINLRSGDFFWGGGGGRPPQKTKKSPDRRLREYWILDFLTVELGFRVPIIFSRISDSLSCTRIPKPRISHSTSKNFQIQNSTSKNFPDSRIRIPLHGAKCYMLKNSSILEKPPPPQIACIAARLVT